MFKPNPILKRLARAILLLLSAALLPAWTQAQFTYTTNADTTLTITGYTGPAGAVTIPTNINGLTVTGIAASSFASNTKLTGVTIPGAITNLGSSLFSGCSNLTSVTFGPGPTLVTTHEFQNCLALTSIVIPSNVMSIVDYAFYNCSNLSNVSFAPGVVSLGQYSFAYCGLTNLTLPATVTNIGQSAFFACQSLTNASILGNCYVSPVAFGYSPPAIPPPPNPVTLLQSVYIAGGTVGSSAFLNCTNLSSLTFGPFIDASSPGVTNIGQQAFQNCTALTNFVMTTNMIVGPYAFQGCTNLGNLFITPGVTSIGADVFAYSGLRNLIVPATVTNIGASAFSGCLYLTNVIILGDCNINSLAFSFIQGFNSYSGSADYALQSVYVAGGAISDHAFYYCTNLVSATLGPGVTSIGYVAFSETALKSIAIPDSCLDIGGDAFQGNGLTNVDLGQGVQNIAGYAFSYNEITSLSLPASLRTIGDEGFSFSPITNLTIANGLVSIGTQCFQGSSISHVTIPPSLVAMGDYDSFAFSANLTAAVFLGNAPSPGQFTFDGCNPNLVVYHLPGTSGWSNTFDGIPTAVWNPSIQKHDGNFGLRNGGFGFNVTGPTNLPVAIQACTNLAGGWTMVTNVTLTNGSFYFSDPQPAIGPADFYRLSPPP